MIHLNTNPPTLDDLDSVSHLSRSVLEIILSNEPHWMCAYDEATSEETPWDAPLVGVAWYVGDGHTWIWLGIRVVNSYQNQGIGTQLVDAVIADVKEKTRGKGKLWAFWGSPNDPISATSPPVIKKGFAGFRNIGGQL